MAPHQNPPPLSIKTCLNSAFFPKLHGRTSLKPSGCPIFATVSSSIRWAFAKRTAFLLPGNIKKTVKPQNLETPRQSSTSACPMSSTQTSILDIEHGAGYIEHKVAFAFHTAGLTRLQSIFCR
jgi:hypothetical protein